MLHSAASDQALQCLPLIKWFTDTSKSSKNISEVTQANYEAHPSQGTIKKERRANNDKTNITYETNDTRQRRTVIEECFGIVSRKNTWGLNQFYLCETSTLILMQL